jgi:hypothetical protein
MMLTVRPWLCARTVKTHQVYPDLLTVAVQNDGRMRTVGELRKAQSLISR